MAALTAVAGLPLGVLVVRAVLHSEEIIPYGDYALLELHTRDVGDHAVLLGPYSRVGWNHPGPLLYYLLAIPYRLTGSDSVGMVIGSLVVAGAAVVGIAVVAHQRGGAPLMAGALVLVALLVHSLAPQRLVQPWNPYVAILPLVLLVLLSWSLACGSRWSLPVVGLVASFVVQCHIGFVPVALAVVAVGTVGLLRAVPWRQLLRPGIVTTGVLAVVWLPVALEVVQPGSSNVRDLLDYYREPQPRAGLSAGLRVVARQLSLAPEWITGEVHVGVLQTVDVTGRPSVPLLLIPFLAALVLAWRRRRVDLVWLGAVAGAALIASVVAVAGVVGPLLFYLVRWTWAAGVGAGFVIVAVALALVGSKRGVVPSLAAALLVIAVLSVDDARRLDLQDEPSPIVADLAEQVLPTLHEGEVVLMRHGAAQLRAGLALQMERAGIDVAAPAGEGWVFGRHRVLRGRWVDVALQVVSADAGSRIDPPRSGIPVARVARLSREERERVLRRREELDRRHRAGRLDDVEYFTRASALPAPGPEVVVFRVPLDRREAAT